MLIENKVVCIGSNKQKKMKEENHVTGTDEETNESKIITTTTTTTTTTLKKESNNEKLIINENDIQKMESNESKTKNIPVENNKKGNEEEQKRSSQLSHASRRVILHNIYKWSKPKDIDKLIQSILQSIPDNHDNNHDNRNHSIQVEKFKKPPKDNWVAITLEKDEMAEQFIKAVNNGTFKKQKGNKRDLFARSASERDNEIDKTNYKRGRENNNKNNDIHDDDDTGNEENPKKRSKIIHVRLSDDEIRDSMTSLWRKPYEAQLKWKWRQMVNKCTKKIGQEVKAIFRHREKEARHNKNVKLYPIYDWLKQSRTVEVHPILPSPLLTEYRNKVELTFGYTFPTKPKHKPEPKAQHANLKESDKSSIHNDTNMTDAIDSITDDEKHETPNVPIVGFTTKGWSGPLSHPHPCQNTPREACGIADIFNQFLATSPIPPYNSRLHQGIWRLLTMRFSKRNKECMLIIQHAPPSGGAGKRQDGKDDYSIHWETEKKRLIHMLTTMNENEDKDKDKGRPIPLPDIIYPEVLYQHDEIKAESTLIGKLPPPSTLITSDISISCTKTELQKVKNANEEKLHITAIYFQEYDGLSNPKPEHPVQHIYGSTAIKERLGQCQFQISPGAFFQVNTEGAEVLYNVVVQKVKEVTCINGANPKDALLFDVCCGTGTIGLTCLKEGVVGKVIGVDISEPAIKDAIINAELNGYKNDTTSKTNTTKFIASRAELVLANELKAVQDAKNINMNNTKKKNDSMIVAVVDPAREGLHNDVLKTLRYNEDIQRLIYVSCNPTGTLVKDAAMLCGPPSKKYPGRPFRPSSAQPVDMFPLTPHCEMVMIFDRMSEDELYQKKKDDDNKKLIDDDIKDKTSNK